MDSSPVGIWTVDPTGLILWANQSTLDTFGYSRDEYVGRNIADLHDDPSAASALLRRLANNETVRDYEAWLRHKNGSLLCLLINATGHSEDGALVHARCFAIDITGRARREQWLLAENGIARVLAACSTFEEAAPDVLQQIGSNLRWRAARLWVQQGGTLRCAASWPHADSGLEPNTELRARIWNAREPLLLAGRFAFGFPIVLGGETQAIIECLPDEPPPPTQELIELTGVFRRQIENFLVRTEVWQRLAESEESYRVLTETASDGILIIDSFSNIRFANSPAAAMFGYTKEELVGADMTMLMPERLRAPHLAALSHFVATGERKLYSWRLVQLAGLHRHGYEFPLEISLGCYRQGAVHVFVGVLRDTSDRARLEEKMRQAAKLESLGVLAGGIAHDFNNLLTGILGNISLTDDMLPAEHSGKHQLKDALEATERAAHLTRQMLAYAGKGKFVIQPVDVSNLVREISPLVRTSIPKHVSIRLDLSASLPPVEADLAQLQQLVMNLVINGAEAVPPDRQGIVLVSTRLERLDGGGDAEPGDYVVISVQDNGSGMDDATKAKIFDPFFTTKFTGRGLGLAAASGIVKGHKGVLRLFSTPGMGTTFRVLLPAMRQHPSISPPRSNTSNLAGQGTVLVVDDEEIVRNVAVASLLRFGYTVITAANGRIGVDRFREVHSQLAAVILDMTMPVMNGEQAFAAMKSIDPAVPVVLSSGYNEAEAAVRFEGRGLAAFLQKPYTASTLAAKIKGVLRS